MKKNVLVFPCGTEIGLEINRALAGSKHFELFGADSTDDHGKYVFKNYINVRSTVEDSNFIDDINQIIDKYNIDFIIPAHDSVVLKMAENQDIIKAVVVTSSLETCRICRSKKLTYELFQHCIPVPKIYSDSTETSFPIFLKPEIGQGSKGTYTVFTNKDLAFYTSKDPSLLKLEYLPGKEYTVDCFTDKKRNLLFVSGRERIRISNGISVKSQKVDNEQFKKIAEIINKILHFQGVWFFQVKESKNGELVLMEISPRIAGTMALFRVDGVNFIQLSLFDRMGMDIDILYNNLDIELDRALHTKYLIKKDYKFIYIDFDDTIIYDNIVNTDIIKFLYQARNMGKKIILLSKHKDNIYESLKKFAISELIFSEIIIIKQNDKKRDYITNTDSIFIDDSFIERKDIADSLHIPVFSLDAVESLIIWKV